MREAAPGPAVLDETGDFAVTWKPSRMHCAPLRDGEGGTLLEWYAARFPPALDLPGRTRGEGGLVHRLDFETEGLVLFAKNRRSLEFLLARQEEGAFVKEYSACCVKAPRSLPGFPPPPVTPDFAAPDCSPEPFVIKSFFRPFGPGRKQVRPVTGEGRRYRETATDRGAYYYTKVLSVCAGTRGPLAYNAPAPAGAACGERCAPPPGPEEAGGCLALRAHRLLFPDPGANEPREYCVAALC